MNSAKLILVGLILILIAMSTSVLATGAGDVRLSVNGLGERTFFDCVNNEVYIMIANDAPLYEFAIGFQLDYGPRELVVSPQLQVVYPLHDFEINFQVDTSLSSMAFYIHGTANGAPLQAFSSGMVIFRVVVFLPAPATAQQLCIDNVVNPETMTWSFRDVAYYSPSFEGVANASISEPTAPQACFPVLTVPCGWPSFSATPPSLVTIGRCDLYAFDFQVPVNLSERCKMIRPSDSRDLADPTFEGAWYTCTSGAIDSASGVYALAPSAQVDTVREVVTAHNYSNCEYTDYAFTIVRAGTYAVPEIASCRSTVRVKAGTSKTINYLSTDPNQCAGQDWSLALLSGTAPESNISIDSVGKVTVNALASDLGETFDYRLIASDVFANADSCDLQIQIVSYLPGDANGDGHLTISDVVYIINCIFGGSGCTIEASMDVNCSGTLTISDVVYLINHIFAGGPAPCL